MPTLDVELRELDRRRNIARAGQVVLSLLAAVVIGAVAWVLREPEYVEQVTVANTTGYGVQVDVRGSEDGGRLLLGWVPGVGERSTRLVLHQGDEWRFTFRYAGTEAGELLVTEDDLEAAGWRIEVPDDVADRLSAAGLEPGYRP